MAYPYRAAWFNYGTRKTTLGIVFHMAEGYGTVGYLDKYGARPPRGVSVHAVCDRYGHITQMLPWNAISGSLNPSDRSTNKGYYGHTKLVAVLGKYWTDPNRYLVSMEIEGYAKNGPTKAQQAAAIKWGREMKARYKSVMRGAIGHADQTNTKGCPGTSAGMKAIFAGVGGHGRW
jgi:hypothetical protein